MTDYNNIDKNFMLDLVSAVDYVGDLEAYLHKCEKESLPCNIQYLKNKVVDIRFDLNSMYDRLCNGVDNKMDLHNGNHNMIEFKPTWYYTENELPKEDEEVFCDTGEFFGYQTLTYDGDVFYNSDGKWFEVTRWVRVSEIVITLNKNTKGEI